MRLNDQAYSYKYLLDRVRTASDFKALRGVISIPIDCLVVGERNSLAQNFHFKITDHRNIM